MSAAQTAGPSELRLRVVSSLALAALALASAWVGGWFLVIVWLGAAIAVAYEWMTMARVEPRAPLQWLLATAITLMALSVVMFGGRDWLVQALAPLLIIPALFVTALILGGATRRREAAWAVGGLLYAAPIAVAPIVLRFHDASGMWPLLWMFAVVWTTDVAAYFVGRAVGGPRLWPRVSPKKTWSGFIGGLLGAVLAGTALAAFADTRPDYDLADVVTIVLLSALASVASQAGDLAESAMKRHFGVKDSGSLIPGHGGFMDRLDGFAAVAMLVCVLIPLAKFSIWTVAP